MTHSTADFPRTVSRTDLAVFNMAMGGGNNAAGNDLSTAAQLLIPDGVAQNDAVFAGADAGQGGNATLQRLLQDGNTALTAKVGMTFDQAGNNELAGSINNLCILGIFHLSELADSCDLLTVDHNAAILYGRAAIAVNECSV